ncbi:Uncharacterized protein FWK35_00021150 [Aphis craccivora]|uniref:Uncharacterized protein n=1 Tax=Aphis craccivora TaxID=307492 RepID=A0A6G0YU83_APHCR|nr:Uncharacterized protein FWK35_00021150 [Aphis craccivora]
MLQFKTSGVVSDGKFDILFLSDLKKTPGKPQNSGAIFTQNQFSTKSIFYISSYNSKTNHCKYIKFSQKMVMLALSIHTIYRQLKFSIFLSILDSERGDECIDFTMIITSRNNAPISNYGDGFRCKNEYTWCIIQVKS